MLIVWLVFEDSAQFEELQKGFFFKCSEYGNFQLLLFSLLQFVCTSHIYDRVFLLSYKEWFFFQIKTDSNATYRRFWIIFWHFKILKSFDNFTCHWIGKITVTDSWRRVDEILTLETQKKRCNGCFQQNLEVLIFEELVLGVEKKILCCLAWEKNRCPLIPK